MERFEREQERQHYFNVLKCLREDLAAGRHKDFNVRFGLAMIHAKIDSEGASLLHYSAELGDTFMTACLIKLGLNINHQNKYGQSPIMIALKKCNEETFKLFLKFNAKLDLRDSTGKTLFHKVCAITNLIFPGALLLKFLENCSTIQDAALMLLNVKCPLNISMLLKNSELIEILVNLGMRDVLGSDNPPALHVGVHLQDSECVNVLLKYNFDPNTTNSLGFGPLVYLADSENCEDQQFAILQNLLNRGVKIIVEHESHVVFNISRIFSECAKEIIQLIIQTKSDFFLMKDEFASTPLHFLAFNRKPGITDLLKNQKLDINARDDQGYTALIFASYVANIRMVEFLLKNNAIVDNKTNEGYTSLFNTIMFPSPRYRALKCINLLLRYGADPQIVTSDELTIIDVIIDYEKCDLAQPILAELAKLEENDIPIKNQIKQGINSDVRFMNTFDELKKEIEQLKNTVVFGSITLFKLLTVDENKLLIYLRNSKLTLNLQNIVANYKDKSTYYRNELQEKIITGLKKIRLSERAADGLFEMIKVSYLSHPLVIDNIFSYLSEKDLLNLGQLKTLKTIEE